MFSSIQRTLSSNATPLGVLVFIALGLTWAALIDPHKVTSEVAARTPTGNVEAPAWRPLPSPSTTLTRIGFASCLQQWRPAPIMKSVIAARPELLLMMGDNVYGDVKSPDLRELNAAYATLASHPDFKPAIDAFPFLATWDDHDYGLNDGGASFEHREASMRLFRSFWRGSGSTEGGSPDSINHARTFGPAGRRVQIIMLDTRSFRSPLRRRLAPVPGLGRYEPDNTPGKTMLGDTQWRWLEQRLLEPADLRIIVSSVQVLAEGHNFERWGNLPRERAKLFDIVKRTGANGVLLLSGDRHRAAIYRNDRAAPYPLYEATSSSLNRAFANPKESGPYQLEPMYGETNFGMLEINWAAGTVSITIRGENGDIVRGQMIELRELKARQE
ncbi:MAG: hypothetical protein RLZ98_51 [Pseudomonadota bacterium]|jgi:alkaline phosphatase D